MLQASYALEDTAGVSEVKRFVAIAGEMFAMPDVLLYISPIDRLDWSKLVFLFLYRL